MNILLDAQITPDIRDKHILLELDTFRTGSDTVTAWCLVDPGDPTGMITMDQFVDLHGNLMPNYRLRHWNYVEQAIGHLLGKWDGQLDSFYRDLQSRVMSLQESDPGPEWDGIIDRSIDRSRDVGR